MELGKTHYTLEVIPETLPAVEKSEAPAAAEADLPAAELVESK